MKQTDLFGAIAPQETKQQATKRKRMKLHNADGSWKNNPMVPLCGETPDKKCKSCSYLFYREFANKYYKCAKRINRSGPASDHRVNWPACGLYVEEVETIKP